MKAGVRTALVIVAGLVAGGTLAWVNAGRGMGRQDVVNGSWSTSLSFGTHQTDMQTRASVARRGLLALPSSETVYWQASVDSDGKPLNGKCSYVMTGGALDARWWSVTLYDKAGYLIANPARIWSFSGASVGEGEKADWRVAISPVQPNAGHWLPGPKGQAFDLTLRMYNPGPSFRASPEKVALPILKREACS